MLNYKKAAMFGLDARIALVIFGAVSVISGAELYNAIQSARLENWRQDFVNLVKATDQYYLDNESSLPASNPVTGLLHIGDLVENRQNLLTWDGPYISAEVINSTSLSNRNSRTITSDTVWKIYRQQSSNWATTTNDLYSDEICVVDSSDCVEYIVLSAGFGGAEELNSLFRELDELIDDSDGEFEGKVRYNTSGANYLMYKSIPNRRSS